MKRRTVAEIVELYKHSPGSLTPGELGFLQRELRKRERAGKPPRDYDTIKAEERRRREAITRAGQNIWPIPPVKDQARRSACEGNLQLFLDTYGTTFWRPWCSDVLRSIETAQRVILHGGHYAFAEPRGFGKTVRAEWAALFSILYGHQAFTVLIGKSAAAAQQSMDAIRTHLETNRLLLEDFPEVCWPIYSLGGKANKCAGQHVNGERTRICWYRSSLVMPTIAGSKTSGAVFRSLGIWSKGLRGLKHTRADGVDIRPTLVICDDLQDKATALNPQRLAKLEDLVREDVLGLAERGRKVAVFLPCTIMEANDLADRLTDPEKNPDWNGTRTKLIYAFPKSERWDEYKMLLMAGQRSGQEKALATKYYAEHRAEMDAGAVLAWPEMHDPDELSGVQYAMDRRFRDPTEKAFWSEDQNEPIRPASEVGQLVAADLMDRVNKLDRGILPASTVYLTAFVDVQATLLYYLVLAVGTDFTGAVVDYGTWPDQGRSYFTLREVRPTLTDAARGAGLEGSIFAGLQTLTDQLLGREWQSYSGTALRIGCCLIDAHWDVSTETVYEVCRQSRYAATFPSFGRFYGLSATPLSHYREGPGERVGLNWIIRPGKRGLRHVTYDTAFWKTFVAGRLRTAAGDKGAWTLYGSVPEAHRMICDQWCAEKAKRITEADKPGARMIDEWKLTPGLDNHLWDCAVGSAVAASILGAKLFAEPPRSGPKGDPNKRRVRWKWDGGKMVKDDEA